MARRVHGWWLAPAVLLACGGDGTTGAPDEPSEAGPVVVGAWYTRGEDPDLGGAVDVRLDLQADGGLRVTVTQPAGASLVFPGTWSVDGDRLTLRGAWFRPDGEVAVTFRVDGDTMILTAVDGGSQTWQRRASAATAGGRPTDGAVQTTRTELLPPYGLGWWRSQSGSSRHSPSTTKRYS